MATIPTDLPEWASQDLNDPVTGSPNKVVPTDSFKLSGVNREEALIRQYLNYELDLMADWINFLNQANLSGTAPLSSGTAAVTIPDQGTTSYQVFVTPSANVGNWWVTKDSSTQFTVSTSAGGSESVDWKVVSKQ